MMQKPSEGFLIPNRNKGVNIKLCRGPNVTFECGCGIFMWSIYCKFTAECAEKEFWKLMQTQIWWL